MEVEVVVVVIGLAELAAAAILGAWALIREFFWL